MIMEEKDRKNGNNANMPQPGNPKRPPWLKWLIFIAIGVFIMSALSPGQRVGMEMSNSEFIQMIENGKITRVAREYRPDTNGYKIHFLAENSRYSISATENDWEEYEKLFKKYGIDYPLVEASGMAKLFWTIFPILLIFMLIMFIMRKSIGSQSKMFRGMIKAPMTIFEKGECKTKFTDVAGCDEAKAEIKEIIEFLENPRKFTKLGAKMPSGYLLVGYPGCGKTLLAKALAGEADVPFLSIAGSEFVQMFVGVGAGRIRSLFETARKKAPCIIFIDEIDALSKRGQSVVSNGHDEAGQTMNQLLKELDGFEINPGIVLLAATNQPDKVDEALMRPGRFDRQITVNKPDMKGREEILQVHVRNKKTAENIDLKLIAKRTPGFTGADLANVANEAAIAAAKKNKEVIEQNDFEKSIDRVTMGHEQKGKIITDEEKKIVAYHEAGHTVVGELLFGDVHKVSIIPRGIGALGHTLMLPEKEKYLLSQSEIKKTMAMLLAGRKSEEIEFNEVTSGAGNDIERATELAYNFVCRFGMDDEVGPQSFTKQSNSFLGPQLIRSREYSENTAIKIDKAIRSLVAIGNKKAKDIIEINIDIVKEIAAKLLEKETLVREEIEAITKNIKSPAEK